MRPAVLTLLVLVLTACGGGGAERAAQRPAATPPRSVDEREIRETLERYAAAIRANDSRAVCEVTAREVLDVIEEFGSRCESFVSDQVREGGPRFELTTTSVRVRGDYAMTRGRAVGSDGPRSGEQPLVRENGRWLLTTKAR